VSTRTKQNDIGSRAVGTVTAIGETPVICNAASVVDAPRPIV
jgi:hypothetical protein